MALKANNAFGSHFALARQSLALAKMTPENIVASESQFVIAISWVATMTPNLRSQHMKRVVRSKHAAAMANIENYAKIWSYNV